MKAVLARQWQQFLAVRQIFTCCVWTLLSRWTKVRAHGFEPAVSVHLTGKVGWTALMTAASYDDVEAIDLLLEAGAPLDDALGFYETALNMAKAKETISHLLAAGADPCHLSTKGRRALLGFSPDSDSYLLNVTAEEFQAGRARRFGQANPERFEVLFWKRMIVAGIGGSQAARWFEDPEVHWRWFEDPNRLLRGQVWTANRSGQSFTFLPDGRIVQVGGQQKDFYDSTFCIYNDVFVHQPDGTIEIYGYPEAVFPPTDFHTATPIGEFIYLVGSLGYTGSRHYDQTSVYRLDTRSWQMEEVSTKGELPGWIYGHAAVALPTGEIRVTGGKIVTREGDEEIHAENSQTYVLHTKTDLWTKESVA